MMALSTIAAEDANHRGRAAHRAVLLPKRTGVRGKRPMVDTKLNAMTSRQITLKLVLWFPMVKTRCGHLPQDACPQATGLRVARIVGSKGGAAEDDFK